MYTRVIINSGRKILLWLLSNLMWLWLFVVYGFMKGKESTKENNVLCLVKMENSEENRKEKKIQ